MDGAQIRHRGRARRQWPIGLLLAMTACGPLDQSDSAALPDGTETVELTVGHRSEWRVLWVEGETDLPDGSYVNYRVTHDLARTSSPDAWPATNLVESGRSTIRDGTYWARVNTLNWPAGTVRVLVQFPFPPQPPEVVARYGEFGEHLTGDNVTERQGIRAIEVEHTFEHRP